MRITGSRLSHVVLTIVVAMAFAIPMLAAEPKIAPDESLAVAEFLELGVPSPDREWTPPNYESLVEAIRPWATSSPRKLPRFDSKQSGEIMRRAVNPANFALLKDPQLPLSVRLPQAIALMQAASNLAIIYVEATNGGESFDRELVELTVLIATINLEMWELVDELMAGLTEEERATKTGALGQIRSGSAQIVDGILISFTERDIYRISELRRQASLLLPILPKAIERLSADSATEMVVRLRALPSRVEDEELREALRKLGEVVEKRRAQTPVP